MRRMARWGERGDTCQVMGRTAAPGASEVWFVQRTGRVISRPGDVGSNLQRRSLVGDGHTSATVLSCWVPSPALDRGLARKLSADGTLGAVHLRHSLYLMMVVMRFTATTVIINHVCSSEHTGCPAIRGQSLSWTFWWHRLAGAEAGPSMGRVLPGLPGCSASLAACP